MLEVLLAVVVGLWLVSGWGRGMARRAGPWLGRWVGGRWAAGKLFVWGFSGSVAITFLVGLPVPRVSDELSYLYAADTYAHGRLANPVHPMARHFTPEHVLVTPEGMASKYPPAQGLVLALGQVVGGRPAMGLWLLAGLLPAAVLWALGPWMPRRWALVGGILVLLRLGVGSYWNQSYWGGSVAAIGGALVLGAWGRAFGPVRGRSVWTVVVGAVGIAMLANSRPFEGALFVVGLGLGAAWKLRSSLARTDPRWSSTPARLVAHGTALGLLVLVAMGMAWLNQRVTGDPWTFPHALYAQEGGPRNFVWQLADPGNDRSGPAGSTALGRWLPFAIADGGRDLAGVLYFLLGISLLVPLVASSRWLWRRPVARGVVLPLGLVVAGHAATTPWLAHYSAPLVAPVLLLAVEALRGFGTWRFRGRRLGGRLVVAALVVQAVLFAVQIPAHRPDPGDWSAHRARIDRELRQLPGRHLVVVTYPRGRDLSWSWNGADPDAQKVVWADALGPAADQQLMAYFDDRTVWSLDIDLGSSLEGHPPRPVRADPAGRGSSDHSSDGWVATGTARGAILSTAAPSRAEMSEPVRIPRRLATK